MELWSRYYGVDTKVPTRGQLHIFDPANADLGVVVHSLVADPVLSVQIYPASERHQLLIRIQRILGDYWVRGVTAEQARRQVEALSLLLSA